MVAFVDITRRFWPLSLLDGWRKVPAYGKRRRAIRLAVKRYAETLGQEVSVVSAKAPKQGRTLLYGGHALGWIGFGLTAYGLLSVTEPDMVRLLLGPFGVGLIAQLAGGYMTRKGRRILQPTAAEVLLADPRRPMLLLRSFRDDDAEIVAGVDEKGHVSTGRLEEAIGPPFSPYGPLVAIGKPGEPLPQFGAARGYFGDADWKGVIARWMDESVFLLVIPGLTKGLGWELERIAARGHGHKMLVMMPPPIRLLALAGQGRLRLEPGDGRKPARIEQLGMAAQVQQELAVGQQFRQAGEHPFNRRRARGAAPTALDQPARGVQGGEGLCRPSREGARAADRDAPFHERRAGADHRP